MDLIDVDPVLNLYDREWPIRTYQPQVPAAQVRFSRRRGDQRPPRRGPRQHGLPGLHRQRRQGAQEHSVAQRPHQQLCASSKNSILFEGVDVGRHCRIRKAIIDKDVKIPPHTTIGYDLNHDRQRGFLVTDQGVVVIAKAELPETFAGAAGRNVRRRRMMDERMRSLGNDRNGEENDGESPNGSPHSQSTGSRPSHAPTKPRSWLWSFIGIAFISVILIGWLALFIIQQFERPLTLAHLQTARNVWQEKGSKDYEMIYVVTLPDKSKNQFYVVVRSGKVKSTLLNGTVQVPPEQLDAHSISALFDYIEVFLKRDAQPNAPKAYSRASFSSDDGRLLWFARQVLDSPERVDIRVQEFKPGAGK